MRRRTLAPILGIAAALALGPAAASSLGATVSGTVGSGPSVGPADFTTVRDGARVDLYVAERNRARLLGSAITDWEGDYSITYRKPGGNPVLYVVARGGRPIPVDVPQGTDGPASIPSDGIPFVTLNEKGQTPEYFRNDRVVLASALTRPVRNTAQVNVSELTTIGTVVAMQQFMQRSRVSGRQPGLGIAADTVQNLAETRTGKPSFAIANSPNGNATESYPLFNTLANIISSCTRGTAASCARLFSAANARGQQRPTNTLEAALNVVSRPSHNTKRLFRLQRKLYSPSLGKAPRAYVVALVYVSSGLNGPGRMAFDSRGRVWSNNNFAGVGTEPAPQYTILSPTGQPILGSPRRGGGVDGAGFGMAIDQRDRGWIANWAGNSISLIAPNGRPISPRTGYRQGGISQPQGLMVDQRRNVWIPNQGTDVNHLTVYPNGNPNRAERVSGGGLRRSFDVAIDADGAAWVTNGAIGGGPYSVTKIVRNGRNDYSTTEFTGGGLASPMAIAVDRGGNKWISNFLSNSLTRIDPDGNVSRLQSVGRSLRGPWGLAVDGNDNLWVSGFRGRTLTHVCGRLPRNCPPGTTTGEAISPPRGYTNRGFQHTTAVQVDSAGGVWLANNWSVGTPIFNFVGGNGLIHFVGLAKPVKTPLIGPPQPL